MGICCKCFSSTSDLVVRISTLQEANSRNALLFLSTLYTERRHRLVIVLCHWYELPLFMAITMKKKRKQIGSHRSYRFKLNRLFSFNFSLQALKGGCPAGQWTDHTENQRISTAGRGPQASLSPLNKLWLISKAKQPRSWLRAEWKSSWMLQTQRKALWG